MLNKNLRIIPEPSVVERAHSCGDIENLFVTNFLPSQETEFKREVSILDLPVEIVLKIFSYLDAQHLSQRVPLVCKLWNNIAKDRSLWKTLSFCDEGKVYHILDLVVIYPYVQCLTLERLDIDAPIIEAICHWSFLKSLTLNFCKILSECQDAFSHFFRNAKKLISLDLEGCEVSKEILDCIHCAKNLKILNLSHCTDLRNDSLIQILNNCSDLESIDIDGINFLDDYSIGLIFRLCSSNLKIIFLDGEGLSDIAFVNIIECLNLTKLGVSFSDSLTDVTLFKIMHLKHLTHLKLRKGINLTAVGLKKMFKEGSLSKVTHLNLSECSSLSDDCLLAITDCCQELVSLNLAWCWDLTEASLIYVVQNSKNLTIMDLTGLVRLCGNFLYYIKQGCLRKLKVLDLEQCGCIDDAELAEVAKERPHLKIFDFWGDYVTGDT